MSRFIPPGSVIGVLGSGQLGRMFAIAARQMGYRVHVFSPDDHTPAGQVADLEIRAEYCDADAVDRFSRAVDAITFEFENVPASAIDVAARHVPIRPGGHVLHTTQDRLREKTFLLNAGLPVTPFASVRTGKQLQHALDTTGLPAVMKTATWGYDGKGQHSIRSPDEAAAVLEELRGCDVIMEKHVDFETEISVVAARGANGEMMCYAPIRNTHRSHILDISSSPAGIPTHVSDAAIDIARQVMVKLDVVGVLCVEFFMTHDRELIINELAPRPHNSGHLTIDAHATSQFEQQVRAVCGLPLGSTEQFKPAAMANLLGDLWTNGPPDWPRACAMKGLTIHVYGKRHASPRRKMGHLVALADDVHTATEQAARARQRLTARHALESPQPASPHDNP